MRRALIREPGGEKGYDSMTFRFRARPGRLLALALATAAFCTVTAYASMAFAADQAPVDQIDLTTESASITQLFQQLANAQVDGAACTTLCHGNIALTKNYSSSIKFSHGNHIIVQCNGCHPRFPHRKTGTERPTMKGCFDCHGLRHSSMGIIAKDNCDACHVTPKWQLRPAFHTADWAKKPHVKPANDGLNTKCMMCHKAADCVDCHLRESIDWTPATGWDYDNNSGCQACHGSSTLLKQSAGASKSFQVAGIDDSAHRDNTCQQCHPDYRYDDKPGVTKLWNINAGIACGTCHQNLEEPKLKNPVAEYGKSVHSKKLLEGDYESATCASCHGGHFIYSTATEAGKLRMHGSAYRTCARCKQHGDEYATYNDYYHGRAYKNGASDAPACWQCHEAHKVLPSADPASGVSAKNIGTTCGQEGCHKGSSEEFGAAAGELIHKKGEAREQNALLQLIARVRGLGGD